MGIALFSSVSWDRDRDVPFISVITKAAGRRGSFSCALAACSAQAYQAPKDSGAHPGCQGIQPTGGTLFGSQVCWYTTRA